MNERGLMDLKEQIDKASQSENRLVGKLSYLLKELKGKYKCKTITEAKRKLVQMKEKAGIIQEQIDNDVEKIKAMKGVD